MRLLHVLMAFSETECVEYTWFFLVVVYTNVLTFCILLV